MAIITQRGTVDLIPEYNRALRPIFCVSEGDANSRVINLSVTSGGEAFTIPSGAMVYVAGKKQDNNIFVYRCSFTSNTVVFPITAQMSALDGIVLCELQIIQNGNPLGTANFVYWVEPSPIQNGTTSESDLNLFEEAISKFENFDHFYADVESMVTEAVANMQIREGQTVIDASLTVSGAAADAKATGDIVRAFMDALVTETTAEAAIATCDDAAGGLPLKKLTANIVPAQAGSGDPSPDNVRLISGYSSLTVTRSGRNILPNNAAETVTRNGVTFVKQDDGIHISGTATGNIYYNLITRNANAPTLKAGTYTLHPLASTLPEGADLRVTDVATQTKTHIVKTTPVTFTKAEDMQFFCFLIIPSGATFSNFVVTPQLEVGTEATDYEPYVAATYPITIPTAAGTVYGGTLTVNSDGSGTLTVDMATVDLGTLNWSVVTGNNYATFSCLKELFDAAYSASTPNILCSIYKPDANNTVSPTGDNYIWLNPQKIIRIKDTAKVGMTANEFKTAMAGQTLVYTLATPTTYALSAVQVATMLNGVNNIWTDAAGTLTTEYYASTGLYVEKKVNAQRNMIAGVEEAMTATNNYSVNDLLIVGNTLYKVTAAISSGAALVVGTNVTETTVAEQLLALA